MSIRSTTSSRSDSRQKLKNVITWYSGLLKKPSDRSSEDVNRAFSHLKDQSVMEKFHPTLLQQMCVYLHYDRLDANIIVIRQGEYGSNWYSVLSGNLAVFCSEKAGQPLCILGPGSSFGEGILTKDPHMMSVVTTSKCELLWLEYKDMKLLWERNRESMEVAVTPLIHLPNLNDDMRKILSGKDTDIAESIPNSASPICLEPSGKMSHAAWVLRTTLLVKYPHMIRDRKYHLRTYRRCMVGSEIVDWILDVFPRVDCREHAVGMCQALLEDGVLLHVCREHPFLDKYLFYRFLEDEEIPGSAPGSIPSEADIEKAEEDLFDVFTMLAQVSPDAVMRMILRKLPEERTQDEIEIIYDELLQIKPLQHLSYTVKRELAGVIMFEAHSRAGTVLFNQGDEGRSWYIILKGSVNVSIYGKGVVCVLGEADDFGKLALMNDAPRAATITLAEDNCHFLRVDKDDFNRILRDVEANTVRLKEHGQDVLVLEKIPVAVDMNGSFHSEQKYSVMAGTPEKMLEYLLETRMEQKKEHQTSDTFLEDFLLTHSVFFPDEKLCPAIKNHYQAKRPSESQDDGDFVLSQKKCVIQFVLAWHEIQPYKFIGPTIVNGFLEHLIKSVSQDCVAYPGLISDHEALLAISQARKSSISGKHSKKKSLFHSRKGGAKSVADDAEKKGIKPTDEYIFKVYCADHTYTTIRLPLNSTVREVVYNARDKLCLGHDPVLCEVKSNGERVMFKERDHCIIMSLSLNGRLFIAPREHIDALTPVPEQEGPNTSTMAALEVMSTKELANQITLYDWELFTAVHEQEMLNKVFGRTVFPDGISANLDQFLRRFEQLQYWVVTEMVLLPNVGKRVQLLRKFIKIAQHCKEQKNFHAFFAITLGLGHLAVSRLSQTWEKLPGKMKKMFSEFETVMEPVRNHRSYRLAVSKLNSPIIPFMPLLIKDMSFTNQGNKTYYDNMVNFEKMHMIAQTLKTVRYCRQQQMEPEPPENVKSSADIRNYVRNLQVIDNQRILTNLSHKCEPRKG